VKLKKYKNEKKRWAIFIVYMNSKVAGKKTSIMVVYIIQLAYYKIIKILCFIFK